MWKLLGAASLVAIALGGPAHAQVRGPLTTAGCLHVVGKDVVQVKGRLFVRTFPGPPNYESVAKGDRAERTYLLKLAKPICLDDGDQFADPSKTFDTVHVSASRKGLWPKLRSVRGRIVTVTGEAFAAFDGHHHAPLVVLADAVDLAGH